MKKIIVLGGGVAGMSAAHELINRGFEVEVYDRNTTYVGGKARSVDVPGTNLQDPKLFLPGEHGFRFFPGFYQHITKTMSEIPSGNKTVVDNLVSTENVAIYQIGKMPIVLPLHFPSSLKDVLDIFKSFRIVSPELTLESVEFFAERIWQLMTSCPDRFLNEYEQISWWEYLEADNFNDAYKTLLVQGMTRSLVAAKAEEASTRTVGTIFLQLLYTMIEPGNEGTDRVLDGPTNEKWLTPWIEYLKAKGVKYHLGHAVTSLQMAGSNPGATLDCATIMPVADPENCFEVFADYFVLATPVEVTAKLINQDMINADPALRSIIKLAPNVEWMNGIQFYLTESFPMHHGHTIYANTNWALTSISQMQFWPDYDLSKRYDGSVKGVLSVDISDWETPGNYNGKAAQDCSIEEVKKEVWLQLKQEINAKREVLTDDMLKFVYLDSDIFPSDQHNSLIDEELGPDLSDKVHQLSNKEPLLVNLVNTWTLRPEAYTDIPNFFLASDYVKTNTDLATMEGANEAARRAVNNILDKEGRTDLCEIFELNQPGILKIPQNLDERRWKNGEAWKNILPVDVL